MNFDNLMMRRYPIGIQALPSAGGMAGGGGQRQSLGATESEMFPGVTSTGYGFTDIGQSSGNDVDQQYIQFMRTMREGVAQRKIAAAERLARMQEAEENSEVSRVLKILDTPIPDRNPNCAGPQMYGSWMRETSKPMQKKTVIELPIPEPEDVWGHKTEEHRKQLMKNAVLANKAGTSQYMNTEKPVEPEWTGYGTGQGSIAPKWDRPSFLFERTDGNVMQFAPPQVNPGGPEPSFRTSENSSVGIRRSTGLKFDTTGAPSKYAVSMGAAVLQPSIKAPLRDQLNPSSAPEGMGLAVLPGGKTVAPQASMRFSMDTSVDTSVMPPNQVNTNVGATLPVEPSIRLSMVPSHMVVGSADTGGRANKTALPPTEFDENQERIRRDNQMRSDIAEAQHLITTVSGMPSAGAAPGTYSDQDGALRESRDQTLVRVSELLQQISAVSGIQNSGAAPGAESDHSGEIWKARNETLQRATTLLTSIAVVSGRTSALPTPATEQEQDGAMRAERDQTVQRVSDILVELNRVSGVTESGAKPSTFMTDREKMDRIAQLQQVLAQDTANIAHISGSVAARPLDADIFGMSDDVGFNPNDPDGRGASTTAKERVYEGDVRSVTRQGFSFNDSAPHAAHVGATVAQPTTSTTTYVAQGLRTVNRVENVAIATADSGIGVASNAEYAATRGEASDFRQAPEQVDYGNSLQNAGIRPNIARSAPAVGEIAGPVRQGNINAGDVHRAIGRANERSGAVQTESVLRTNDNYVTATNDVSQTYIPQRTLGASAAAPEVTVKPDVVTIQTGFRGTINPLATFTPQTPIIETKRLSVRDALRGMRHGRRLR